MQETVDECYDRVGKYLDPDITTTPIRMGSGTKHIPHQGVCARTGIDGLIVDHKKSDGGGLVPTHTKLLWMVGYQNRIGANGTLKPYRLLGHIAILPDAVLTTIGLVAPIPNLRVVETTKELVRQVLGVERYLFLSFGKNTDRTLGNGLRLSFGARLEVNGELKIAGMELINQSIDFSVPQIFTEFRDLEWADIYRYFALRNRTARSEVDRVAMHAEILDLRAKFGGHGEQMLSLSRRATQQDLRIGRWLTHD